MQIDKIKKIEKNNFIKFDFIFLNLNILQIIYSNLNDTSKEVINLINNKKQMEKLRNNALKKWINMATYREDITNALEDLFSENY